MNKAKQKRIPPAHMVVFRLVLGALAGVLAGVLLALMVSLPGYLVYQVATGGDIDWTVISVTIGIFSTVGGTFGGIGALMDIDIGM